MSDVWEFKNGVIRIVEMENLSGRRPQQLLVYLQTEELTTSHQMIEDRLRDEGWVHYPEMLPELIQYHRGPNDNYDRGPDDKSDLDFDSPVSLSPSYVGPRSLPPDHIYMG
ncbi:hypothetical protein ZIOFF_035108 [Zingiber officinale]|uniref:Uncharacterized protein n=1 Tax=Zingiber officinale TaxID=94328 RepID=A0A8J5GAM5_ZINOF|nr:hypothetical protein ZIOFF_035108 [Zingiber officinale]